MWSLWWGHMRSLGEVSVWGPFGKYLWEVHWICARFLSEGLWGNMRSLREASVWNLCGRHLCRKSLLRAVSVKSWCIVSVCSSHFWSCCTLWKTEQWRKGKRTGFFLFSCCSISITCVLPAGATGVRVQVPHIPRAHFWVPRRGSSNSQAQVPALSPDSSHKSSFRSHCSAHSRDCLGN